MRARRAIGLGMAAALAWLCPAGRGAVAQPRQQAAPAFLVDAQTPKAERDFIAIVDKARSDFMAGRSVDARTGARIALQIDIHQYMGLTHNARDWVGVFMGSNKTEDGYRSIAIQIAPGLSVSSWDSRYVDEPYATMVKPFGTEAQVIDSLTIGQPVVFNADLIGEIIGADDEMVLHPRIIARVTKLTGIDSPLPIH